jgi:hypothetical protein
MTQKLFEGIDFAHRSAALGECFITDDGSTLRAIANPGKSATPLETGLDCPFGTSMGMQAALLGEICDDACGDGFKSRCTELWLRNILGGYASVQRWCNRASTDCVAKEPAYFNSGGHVQPTLGMSIVPECLLTVA